MTVQLAGRMAQDDREAVVGFCPIERAMQVVGTRSAMLLMREAAYGTRRFDQLARRAGLTEAVTASRLRELVEVGLLAKEPYREPGQRTRQAYVLTDAGRDLWPVLLALASWGERHAPARRGPAFSHVGCGGSVSVEPRCAAGHSVPPEEVEVSA